MIRPVLAQGASLMQHQVSDMRVTKSSIQAVLQKVVHLRLQARASLLKDASLLNDLNIHDPACRNKQE